MTRRLAALACLWAIGLLLPVPAVADCALIPAAVKPLLSSDGKVDRPFAAPGDVVTVFSDSACKPGADKPHFAPVAASNQISLVFQPPTGGTAPSVVPVAASSVANCGTARCFALKFTMPDTTGRAGAFPLTGPARIEVRNTAQAGNPLVASIDELFQPTKGCNALNRKRNLFRNFTVLPPRNTYPSTPGAISLQATVDGTGAILIPFDYTDVLVDLTGGTGALRLLKVAADLPNGLSESEKDAVLGPGHPDRNLLRIPQSGSYARSFAFNGRPIPPLLEVTSSGGLTAGDTAGGAAIDFGDTLLGSVDFIDSVIRIASIGDPGGGPLKIFQAGSAGLDLKAATDGSFGASGPVGPIELAGVTVSAGAAAPLNSLKSSKRLAVVARDERLESAVTGGAPNQNADADQDDQVVEFTDLESGVPVSTGQAVAEVNGKAVIATAGTTVAFLQSEAHQSDSGSARVDLTADNDALDQILRVWTADGSHPSCGGSPCELTSLAHVVNPDVRLQGPSGLPSPIVVSGPPGEEGRYVFYGRSETLSAPLASDKVSETSAGAETTGASTNAAISGSGGQVAFTSTDPKVAGGFPAYFRVSNPGGNIYGYATFSDFIANPITVDYGAVAGYADDPGFFYDPVRDSMIRVTASSQVLEYTSFSDFVSGQSPTNHGTVSGYGDDAGFFYDGFFNAYIQVEDTGRVLLYSGFADFSSGSNPVDFLLPPPPGYGNSAGFFFDFDRASYFQIDGSGNIIEYATSGDFLNGTSTTNHGVRGGYGNDPGFFHIDSVAGVGPDQVYVRDYFGAGNELLSQSDASGAPGDCDADHAALDADGDVAVFLSCASNLVASPGGANGDQVYLRNRTAGTTVRVSNTPGGDEPNGPQRSPIVSGDGNVVAFITLASDIVPGIPGPGSGLEVIAYDVGGGTSELISIDDSGERSGRTLQPGLGISNDGNLIAFSANVGDLLPPGQDTNGTDDVFVRDRAEGSTARVSLGFGGVQSNGASTQPHLSGDGRYVVFRSAATNLLSPGSGITLPGGSVQCYVYDRETKTTELVSRTLSGDGSNGSYCDNPSIDIAGRLILFTSNANNLFPGTSAGRNAYLHDRVTGITTLVNRAALTSPSAGTTGVRVGSGTQGEIAVVFDTAASDLGTVDGNGVSDVYRNRVDFPGGTSFNQSSPWFDSDAFDTVLYVFDTQTATHVNTEIPMETFLVGIPVAVAGGRAAVISNALPNIHIWDAALGLRIERSTAGSSLSEVAMSESLICASLTSIGYVYLGHPAGAGSLAGTLEPGQRLAADDERCFFTEPGTDRLRFIDIYGPQDTGATAVDFQMGDDGVAFRSCESAEGDLNLDGDTADCAMRFWYYDPPTPPLTQLVETGQVAIPCTFKGCDPFFEPYRVLPGIVSFITSEPDEQEDGAVGVPGTGTSCLPNSPAGVCDKTGDGDGLDVAVEIFNLESFRSQVFPLSLTTPPEVPPFPEVVEGDDADKNVMMIQLPASVVGGVFAGLPPTTPVTLVVGDTDKDFVFDTDGNRDAKTTVVDGCPEDFDPEQIDLNKDELNSACSFVLDTTTPNDDPQTAPEPPEIPGDSVCDLDGSGVISRAEVDQVWADRGTPIDDPFDRDSPPDFILDAADDRDRDVDGEVSALDFSLCLADCSAQPVSAGNPNGGCPLTETTPTVGGGYKNKGCGLLGIEAWLVLVPCLVLRARRRRARG